MRHECNTVLRYAHSLEAQYHFSVRLFVTDRASQPRIYPISVVHRYFPRNFSLRQTYAMELIAHRVLSARCVLKVSFWEKDILLIV